MKDFYKWMDSLRMGNLLYSCFSGSYQPRQTGMVTRLYGYHHFDFGLGVIYSGHQ